MTLKPKLSTEQRREIAQSFASGNVTREELAAEFNVGMKLISKVCRDKGAMRPSTSISPSKNLLEFASRAKSVLWREDAGVDKKLYNKWVARVEELSSEEGVGYTKQQSIVRASKEFPCLKRIMREYDLSKFDPTPESHPSTRKFGKKASITDVHCEGVEQTYRESLRWAIDAAGASLRPGGEEPTTCPCDAAYYLYVQAISDPKDFLGKIGQIESKVDAESAELRSLRKDGERSIAEIDKYLIELGNLSQKKEERDDASEDDARTPASV